MQPLLFVEAGERAPQRLRRKALDAADSLLGVLDAVARNEPRAVHDARRRLKELRALASLVGAGKDERRFFRDAGRQLSAARDAKAAVEAFDRLRERFASEWTPRQYQKIRRGLKARLGAATDAVTLENLRSALLVERGRIAAWDVDDMRRNDLCSALARSDRRARRGMRRALEARSAAAVHEWRKRVKRYAYDLQFLTDVGVMPRDADLDALWELSRTLGRYHDLALIDDLCRHHSELLGSRRYVHRFRTFVERALAELFENAERAGGELFADRIRIGPKKSPRRLTRVRAARANAG
ncbi:MAG TPA: CHAD domain-containing protein [Thermoanaerobaculia bacterium]|nr:CHAD domain-containing protein [Thermoanaerobaculia bacterium]